MKIIFAVALAFTLLGLGVFLKNPGPRPTTVIMRPSNFDSPEQLGVVLFKRFWSEVRSAPVIVFASSPFLPDSQRVWRGFLAAAREQNIVFSEVLELEGLASLDENSEQKLPRNLYKTVDEIVVAAGPFSENTNISPNEKSRKKIIHMVANDQSWSIAQKLAKPTFFLFQSILPLNDTNKQLLESTCKPTEERFQISCQSINALSERKKKKINLDKYTGYVEKHFDRLHIVYIQPGPSD